MFHSAVLKLTVFYFALLLFVCIAFSVPTYSIASQRITRGAENQEEIFRHYGNRPKPPAKGVDPFDPAGAIRKQIDEQIKSDQQELLRAIIISNVLILLLGTVLCYLFAKRTLKPIEESHEAQSRFTADASHELRTPLTVMKTEIEVALLQKLSAEKLRAVLKSNLEEIEKLSALSNQLLALTRMEDASIEGKTFDLSELVSNEIGALEKQFSISIEKSIDPKIKFFGVEPLCKDLVNILAANAVQYSGENAPEISITLTQSDKRITLTVADKGIGIDEADLPHIFERFFRGKQALSKRDGGHGLGLSLALEIVERQGGRISVVSQPGRSTQFTVVF